jgi:hypothetical protein
MEAREIGGCGFVDGVEMSMVLSAGLEARLYGRQDACHYNTSRKTFRVGGAERP